MNLRHPFSWLPPEMRARAFTLLLFTTLLLMVALQILGRPLQNELAPAGIVSFEFARELTAAQGMVQSWGAVGRIYAGLNLGLDYLFMVSYASAIGLGCVLVERRLSVRSGVVVQAGALLAWGQFGAATLDGIENYALIRLLLSSQNAAWPILAYWCALLKFALVAAGLAYVLFGGILARARGAGQRRE